MSYNNEVKLKSYIGICYLLLLLITVARLFFVLIFGSKQVGPHSSDSKDRMIQRIYILPMLLGSTNHCI